MTNERMAVDLSEFMRYLAKECVDDSRLPPLKELSQNLKVSTATLREQLEVARALGLVEVRPKRGIRRLPYTFRPVVTKSLSYAASINQDFYFQSFSDLRTHIESAYWVEAVNLLTPEDHASLRALVDRAMEKLQGSPIQIPHPEHRELHLSIYRRLGNPFVTGILEAYWEAYEAFGLNLYTDITYLNRVWVYHKRMVEAICAGDAALGYQLLMEHTDLLSDLLTQHARVRVSRFE